MSYLALPVSIRHTNMAKLDCSSSSAASVCRDTFYKRNKANFFKDRHYFAREFPELVSTAASTQGHDCVVHSVSSPAVQPSKQRLASPPRSARSSSVDAAPATRSTQYWRRTRMPSFTRVTTPAMQWTSSGHTLCTEREGSTPLSPTSRAPTTCRETACPLGQWTSVSAW